MVQQDWIKAVYKFRGFAARRLGCQHTANDVIQNACIALLRNEEKIKTLEYDAMTAYVLQVVKSKVIDHIRKEQTRKKTPLLKEGKTYQGTFQKIEIEDAYKALPHLLPQQKTAVLAMAVGYKAREIASVYNVGINTALGYIRGGRRRILKQVGE